MTPSDAPIDPISPISPEAITDRQREVARLVAESRTNTEIADELGITIAGAKYHVSELLTRLGLRRREEVGEWYRAHFGPVARFRSTLRRVFAFPSPLGWGGLAAAIVTLVAVAAIFVALRGASSEPGTSVLAPESSPVATEPAASLGGTANPYVRILEMVPGREDVFRYGIVMGNPALGRELSRADASTVIVNGQIESAAVSSYLMALPEPALHPSLEPLASTSWSQLVYDSLGVNPWAVDQWFGLIFHGVGPSRLSGITGAFQAAEMRDTLEACGQCESPVVEDERNGWIIRGWGEDGSVNPEPDPAFALKPPLYDDFGFGGRIAFRDGVIVRSASLEPVMTLAGTDRTSSLAANEDFRLLAEHLEEEQALQARLFPVEGWRLSESMDGDWADALRSSDVEPLGPFVTWADGQAYDTATERPYNVLVLVHETAEQAQRNADLLPARLEPALAAARVTEHMTDYGHGEDSTIEVETDGRVVIATITGSADSLGPSNPNFIGYLIASE